MFVSPLSGALDTGKGLIGEKNSGYIQISPSREGPWTTVKLNYIAHAACWPLGNAVVASEVIVEDGNRYVNIRSLVSVSNNTDLVLELCLHLDASNENLDRIDDARKESLTNEIKRDEFFETEKLDPAVGWVGASVQSSHGTRDVMNADQVSVYLRVIIRSICRLVDQTRSNKKTPGVFQHVRHIVFFFTCLRLKHNQI